MTELMATIEQVQSIVQLPNREQRETTDESVLDLENSTEHSANVETSSDSGGVVQKQPATNGEYMSAQDEQQRRQNILAHCRKGE
jgi:hypothetical protein